MNTEYQVHAFWDKEAHVWVAESDDVPGLVTEAESIEKLIDKLHILIPELLKANGFSIKRIPFHLVTDWKETIAV